MSTNAIYDVFSGLKDKEPMWLETAGTREAAYEQMLTIAFNQPGSYFVFCSTTSSIIYAVDTTIMRRQAVAD